MRSVAENGGAPGDVSLQMPRLLDERLAERDVAAVAGKRFLRRIPKRSLASRRLEPATLGVGSAERAMSALRFPSAPPDEFYEGAILDHFSLSSDASGGV